MVFVILFLDALFMTSTGICLHMCLRRRLGGVRAGADAQRGKQPELLR